MEDFAWAQFALVFWLAACFFAAGARMRTLPMGMRTWWEIVQAALIVVLLFALLTEGRGCRAGGSTVDEDAVPCLGPRC